jgi:hypothetical protein
MTISVCLQAWLKSSRDIIDTDKDDPDEDKGTDSQVRLYGRKKVEPK